MFDTPGVETVRSALMARPLRRVQTGGYYHVLNRGNGGMTLFHKPADSHAFLGLLGEAQAKYPIDVLAFCLMSNHWHLVVRPRAADALAGFMRWVGVTHVRRHHAHYNNGRGGHLYQGRFKSFPIQDDRHFLTVCRYVEANPLRAGLVERAEQWPFSSLGYPPAGADGPPPFRLAAWPVERPARWAETVNELLPVASLAALRQSVNRGRPFGDARWVTRTADRLGLQSTMRDRGRPRGSKNEK